MSNSPWGSSVWSQLKQVKVDRNGVHAPVRARAGEGLQIGDPAPRVTGPARSAGAPRQGPVRRLLAGLRGRSS